MSSEIAKVEFNDEQVALIRRTLCQGASNDELALFIHQCKRTGLDPFARQIYLVKRQGKMVIQTGIDGYRLIADRTGAYAGNDDPIYDDEAKPRKATVTVYKLVGGVRCPFTATARWDQYFPGDAQGFMWKKMPHLMLGKCAEALALRKAFPQELSGIYTNEEMEQAGPVDRQHGNGHAEPVAELPAKKTPPDNPKNREQAISAYRQCLEIPDREAARREFRTITKQVTDEADAGRLSVADVEAIRVVAQEVNYKRFVNPEPVAEQATLAVGAVVESGEGNDDDIPF